MAQFSFRSSCHYTNTHLLAQQRDRGADTFSLVVEIRMSFMAHCELIDKNHLKTQFVEPDETFCDRSLEPICTWGAVSYQLGSLSSPDVATSFFYEEAELV